MLSLILFFLLISSGSVYAAVRYGRRYEETVPLTLFCCVELVFLFGLIDQLKLGFWVVCALAAALYAVSGVRIAREKNLREVCEKIFTPALFIFIALLVVYAFAIIGRVPWQVDEFSFWAISVKKMWYTNKFACATGKYLSYIEYPPGMQLLQYVLLSLRGAFTDWMLSFAHVCYLFALPLPFIKGLRFRRPLPLVLAAALVFSCGTVFYSSGLDNLQVDLALGATFAYGLAMLFLLEKKNGSYDPLACADIVMAANMLALIKSAGALLAVALLVALLLVVLSSREKRGTVQPHEKGRLFQKMRFTRKGIAYAAACFPLLTWFLWKMKYSAYLDAHSATFDTGRYDLLEFIMIMLSKADGGYRNEIKINFFMFFFREKTDFGILSLTNFQIVLFVALGFLLLFWLYRGDRSQQTRQICVCGTLSFFAVAYWLGLLCSYMYTFSQDEGLALASMQRYLNIYHTGAVLCILFLLLEGYGRFHWDSHLFCAVLIVSLTFTSAYDIAMLLSRQSVRLSIAETQGLRALADRLPKTQDEATVLLIHKEGIPAVSVDRMRYLTYEDYYVPWVCSYGSRLLFEGDIYTRILTADEFREYIYELGVDYIACDCLDDDFITQYSALFDASLEDGQIYRVGGEGELFSLVAG